MNEAKQIRLDLYERAFSGNEGLLKSKKKIRLLMVFTIAGRVILSIVQTAFCIVRNYDLSNCVIDYFVIGIIAICAYYVVKGNKGYLTLMAAAGGYSIITLFLNSRILQSLKMGDMLYDAYIFTIVAVCALQIVVCIYTLLNIKFSEYFSKMTEINRTVADHAKLKK